MCIVQFSLQIYLHSTNNDSFVSGAFEFKFSALFNALLIVCGIIYLFGRRRVCCMV